MSGLWQAVDRLTSPTREKLERDQGATQWVRLPSLFDQLVEAVQSGRGSEGHGRQASRPPLDIACVSLLIEIAEAVADAMRSYERNRTFHTPTDLRSVASSVVADPDGDQDWWTEQIQSWCGQIRAVISNDVDRPWHLHGVACPECAAIHVTNPEDGELVRRPAVVVTWARGYVRAVECRMCGAVWYRGSDLERLVEKITARHANPDAALPNGHLTA